MSHLNIFLQFKFFEFFHFLVKLLLSLPQISYYFPREIPQQLFQTNRNHITQQTEKFVSKLRAKRVSRVSQRNSSDVKKRLCSFCIFLFFLLV